MHFLLFFLLCLTIKLVKPQVYKCPNYEALNQPRIEKNVKIPLKCNFGIVNPKKVINPYKKDIENYVQPKPFGSICLKCSMCLAIAKEMDKLFKKVSEENQGAKQAPVVEMLKGQLNILCDTGFENHDLRKVNQYQIVTDELSCSTHVRSKMDGHWTPKLREICTTYVDSMDIQTVLNEYLKNQDNITKYLCRHL